MIVEVAGEIGRIAAEVEAPSVAAVGPPRVVEQEIATQLGGGGGSWQFFLSGGGKRDDLPGRDAQAAERAVAMMAIEREMFVEAAVLVIDAAREPDRPRFLAQPAVGGLGERANGGEIHRRVGLCEAGWGSIIGSGW